MLDDKKKYSCHRSKSRSQTNFRQYQQLKSRDGKSKGREGKRRQEKRRKAERSSKKRKSEEKTQVRDNAGKPRRFVLFQ